MKGIKVQYEYWMNYHSDDWSVRNAWRFLENILESLPEEDRSKLDQKLLNYVEHLEYQAYSAGFAAAFQLSSECYAKAQENSDR